MMSCQEIQIHHSAQRQKLTHQLCCCCCWLPFPLLPLLGLPVQVGSRVSGGGEGASPLTPLASGGVVSDGEDVCRGYLHQKRSCPTEKQLSYRSSLTIDHLWNYSNV